VSIRPAVATDLPVLLALIRELAVFEREPSAVAATEAGMRRIFFGDAPAVSCSVAEENGAVVALAVWYLSYSTWTGTHGIYLEDLIVTAAARGRGHGRALVRHLAQICVEQGYARLEWSVLDWNDTAAGFYRALGAAPLQEWVRWRVSGARLTELGGRS
jgi:ribosomal protein S18 acetylase RimI-like enzyme